ncbi:MAG: response regulator [Chloroflexi bacterium]|nr:MAG: response regulator [Chloroflexota bacterium]
MKPANTILIIDDQHSARETLKAVLTGQGYNLQFAVDGMDGLQKAAELLPDLIILDIMMPGMDGFEVCERLRNDSLLAEVPIIMLTSLEDFDTRVRGLESGADDFVSKPFNRVELLARIRTITRLNRYRRLLLERTKFDWVVDQAKDGYLVVNDDDLILYANPQARLYLGLPVNGDEPVTEAFLDLARKQYRYEPQEAWLTWPETPPGMPDSTRYLVRPESSTANVFWLRVDTLKLPANPDGGWVIQLTDITAQRILERDMRGFHMMVSHKLRTPLAGILGGLRLLAQSGATIPQDKVVTLSQMALENVERLYHSLGDVLEYLNAPFATRSRIKFNLGQLETTIREISQNLGLENVSVSVPDEVQNLYVSLSQRAAELSLWEILENSTKFHPEQTPTVQIEVSNEAAGHISLKITDDGTGLSPEQLAQIWAPYYQGDKYATGEIKGMGLGLAMVSTLMHEVGAECRAYNRKDAPGLVIELILPVVHPNEVQMK